MLSHGWLEEVRRLLALPYPLGREAAQAAGYCELAAYQAGTMTMDQAVKAIKTHTRQLAKRQLTWLRNFPGLEAINLSGEETVLELAELCLKKWALPVAN
jgi:tRNA dimethylallyltransferase